MRFFTSFRMTGIFLTLVGIFYTYMAKTRQQKEENVVALTDKVQRAKAMVFTDYKGMTMGQLSDLRNKLRDQGAEFTITKNTMLTRALPTSNYQLPTTTLEGPTATLFSYEDEISPLKTLTKAIKDNGLGSIKGGILNGEYLDQYSMIKLSTLPTKDELRGKVVGVLVAPLQGMVGVLQGNLRNLVYALDQVRISKGGEV